MHSVFAHAINVQCDGGHLVTLHGPGLLRAPFAVACDRLPEVAEGDAVVRTPDGLCIGLVRLTPSRTCAVAEAVVALAPDRPELRRTLQRQTGPAFPALAERASSLRTALRQQDPAAFGVAAVRLIGFGPGLTPSGDDCLVGALAVLWGAMDGNGRMPVHPARRARPAVVDRVRDAVATHARRATTDVGAEFIEHALAGEFSEPLQRALATGDAAPLLTHGATSGADTLFGAIIALEALA